VGLAHESKCTDSYKPRKYRVQYQETDFAFVSRLLEDAGISFVLEQREGGTTVVLRDAPEAVAPRATPLAHVNEPTAGQLYATGLRAQRRVRQGRTTFADHDPRLPNQPLLAAAITGQHPLESRLESFVYTPGAFKFGTVGAKETPTADDRGRTRTDLDESRLIAERDAAVRVARSQRFSFRSNCLELRAGAVLSLSNHPIADKFKKLLLTNVRTILGESESEAVVSAGRRERRRLLPARADHPPPQHLRRRVRDRRRPRGRDHPLRRVRPRARPVPLGSLWQDGRAVLLLGPGEPAVGRRRLRHGQPAAHRPGGARELPRRQPRGAGDRRPHLHQPARPPFALPAAKNESGFRSKSVPETGGFNLLRFVDTAGSELVEGRAEKDMYTRVNNDKELSVGNDRRMEIENDDEERIGGNQRESVEGQAHAGRREPRVDRRQGAPAQDAR
jgi:type VI secretion system secreted protein VgrG